MEKEDNQNLNTNPTETDPVDKNKENLDSNFDKKENEKAIASKRKTLNHSGAI